MIDLSKYSCDKCKRVGSWHCKCCWHTVNKKPTHFKPKKETGIQTPEFRKTTPPPPPPTSGSNAVKPNPNYVPPASVKKPCPYELPCGWCAKWDKKCDKKIGCEKSGEPHKQFPIEDLYDWSTMSPMQREDVLECIKIYNKWHEAKINHPKDGDLIYIKSGLGLPPLNTDKTEIPGIRKEN